MCDIRAFGCDHRIVLEDLRVGDLLRNGFADSTSQMLIVPVVGHRQYKVVRNTQKTLQDHRSLQDISVILDIDELSEKDKLTIVRVCNVKRFLSEFFFVAEFFTGIPKKSRAWV